MTLMTNDLTPPQGNNPDDWHAYAQALIAAGDVQAAAHAWQTALQFDPTHLPACLALADILAKTDNLQQAQALYGLAGHHHPTNPHYLLHHAQFLLNAGDPDQALILARQLTLIAPDQAHSHLLMALVLAAKESFDDAANCLKTALEIDPHDASLWYNLGNACQQSRRLDQAIAAFDQALTLNPNHWQTAFNRSLVLLDKGDYRAAWSGFEHRFSVPGNRRRQFAAPSWDGHSDLAGKTILVWNEQGFGDVLQFSRFIAPLRQTGARVILQVHPELLRLIDAMAMADKVIADKVIADTDITSANAPDIDFETPLMSLPGYLNQAKSDLPPPMSAPLWQSNAQTHSPGLTRIGLVWAGGPGHANDHHRSLPLGKFAPLFDLPNIEWNHLQIGPAAEQSQVFPQIVDATKNITDFWDTAQIMLGLDAVISVDTATAHLAGMLGLPVYLLVPWHHDWRWGTEGQTCPWYPAMRLYRQPAPDDDWQSLMIQLRRDLAVQYSPAADLPPSP